MVSIVVSKMGMTKLIFVDPPWNESQWPVLPQCLTLSADAASDQACCRRYVVFQQENAPSHRAKNTTKLLQQEMPDFTGLYLWPSNSPDPNLVDYKVWSVMQQRVYERGMNSVDELKQRLVEVWNSLQQNVIDAAFNGWRQELIRR